MSEQIYKELVDICSKSDAFYFAEQELAGNKFRIFNYRLASYSEWQVHPWAREMRGLMYEVAQNGDFIRLACRPMSKFFNLNENPMTIDLELDCPGYAYDKLDGSLISSYMYNDEGFPQLGLKSKGSLHSVQAVEAFEWLQRPENAEFYSDIVERTSEGYTVDFEWTAPQNRVVIGYTEPKLTILGIRKNDTGDDYSCSKLSKYTVYRRQLGSVEKFVKMVPPMKGIEGYVIVTENGDKFKLKTDQYLALHRLKDDVSSPKKVAEVIMSEGIDDFKAAFHEDALLIQMIERMEGEVRKVFNGLGKKIDSWYEENKALDRKSYAIKGQADMPQVFGLVMSKYLGKPTNLKDYIMKNFEEFFPQTDWYQPTGVSGSVNDA